MRQKLIASPRTARQANSIIELEETCYILRKSALKNSALSDIQGEWTQTVKSNLDLTEKKYAINFNLKVNSDQGRFGIYP